jgi:hypothetical protein
VGDLAAADRLRHALYRGGDRVHRRLALRRAHQPEQVAGLRIVVVAGAVVVAVGR